MAVSKPFLEDVVGKLGLIVPIRAKAMFGGYGLYGGDKFFAVIDDDRLYFKVGKGNVADFEALQCAWFDPMNTGKPMSYRELPKDLLDKPEELAVWVDKSLGEASPPKKRKK